MDNTYEFKVSFLDEDEYLLEIEVYCIEAGSVEDARGILDDEIQGDFGGDVNYEEGAYSHDEGEDVEDHDSVDAHDVEGDPRRYGSDDARGGLREADHTAGSPVLLFGEHRGDCGRVGGELER